MCSCKRKCPQRPKGNTKQLAACGVKENNIGESQRTENRKSMACEDWAEQLGPRDWILPMAGCLVGIMARTVSSPGSSLVPCHFQIMRLMHGGH